MVSSSDDVTPTEAKVDGTAIHEDKLLESDACEETTLCGCIPVSGDTVKGFHQMMNLSLLKDSIFIMFVVSNFLTSIGFNVPYVYTVVSKTRFRDVYIKNMQVFY